MSGLVEQQAGVSQVSIDSYPSVSFPDPTRSFLEALPAVSGLFPMRRIRSEEAFESLGFALDATIEKFHCSRMLKGDREELDSYMKFLIASQDLQNSFIIFDLGHVYRLYNAWFSAMPRVKPFYAVKCCPNPGILEVLATLGAGFDTASKSEMEAVMRLGVPPERVIFANPCKLPEHIKYAVSMGITKTTFDSEDELRKLARIHPKAQVVLRIAADDPTALYPLGSKYGAFPYEYKPLIQKAQALGMNLLGVSFHIGSGASCSEAYYDAISKAREVFDIALELGLPPLRLLDIGGGFTNGGKMKFLDAAAAVNSALRKFFPVELGVAIIAEPGRYFAEGTGNLATYVFGKRCRLQSKSVEYWLSDGMYGTLTYASLEFPLLNAHTLFPNPNAKVSQCTLFGPTCDSLDIIRRDILLPEMNPGDWMVFNNMGSYTSSTGTSFNGFETCKIPVFYAFSGEEVYVKDRWKGDDNSKATEFPDCAGGLGYAPASQNRRRSLG